MIDQVLGIIDKMRIEVRKNPNDLDPTNTIFVQFNPNSYTINKKIEYCEGQPMGSSDGSLSFNKIEPEEVSFDFIFDATGIAPPAKFVEGKGTIPLRERVNEVLAPAELDPRAQLKTVENEVEEFKSLLTGYIGDTHEVSYLKLIWGGYLLDCRLTNMSVEYTLFRKDGRPIRAKASCTFKGSTSYQKIQAKAKKESSDITHIREYYEEERLSFMAEKIYKSKSLYIQVAERNQLLSFRKIKPQTHLYFPPLH